MRRPVNTPYTITQGFGVPDPNSVFGMHTGVDYALQTGREVYAPAAGRIHWAGLHATGGNMVILYDGKYFHRLMHNSRLDATTGQQVTEGQRVALSGTTGLSTGPHVHWDVSTEILSTLRPSSFSKFIDPAAWLVINPPQGGTMSTLGREEVDRLSQMAFGYPATEVDYKEQVGKESNDRIRWYYANPARQTYLSQRQVMTREQAQQLALYMRLGAGETVDEANAASEYDVNHILADPAYAAALAKQIYNNSAVFRHKGAHYDEDIKALQDQIDSSGGGEFVETEVYVKKGTV